MDDRKSVTWTREKRRAAYEKWVRAARDVAAPKALSEWELRLWNEKMRKR